MTDRADGGFAAEYVLGLLEGRAKADADRLFASDAAFALEVERWRQRFANCSISK